MSKHQKNSPTAVAGGIANIAAPPAGNDLQTALVEAAKQSSIDSAAAQTEAIRENRIAKLFTGMTFKAPARAWSRKNAKTGATSRLMASVSFLFANVLICEFGIFADERENSDANGRWLESTFGFSLPRGLGIDPNNPADAILFDLWQHDVIRAYDAWSAEAHKRASEQTGQQTDAMRPRLVKRVLLDQAPAAPAQKTA